MEFYPEKSGTELNFKSIFAGILMAIVLGAANTFLGLKAGMTVSATIPAAVISIGIFKMKFYRGTIYDQNIARTIASVGEALAAGAIFTIPAFVIVELNGNKIWQEFNFWVVSFILVCGGLLGILFVILLRKALVNHADLPFPESVACYEIVQAGQKKESGAGLIFSAMGISALIQFFKDDKSIVLFKDVLVKVIKFPVAFLSNNYKLEGAVVLNSPASSPALLSIGYIVGYRISAINFSGGMLSWLVLIPLVLLLNPDLSNIYHTNNYFDLSYIVWKQIVRPIAVGAMLVGSIYTLYTIKDSLISSFKGAFSINLKDIKDKSDKDTDIPFKIILLGIIALSVPITFIYYYFTGSIIASFISSIVMIIAGFLFSAVGSYLVGLVGGSNQPVSGLTLSSLILSAILMLIIGTKGLSGIAAVLGVAAVVSAAICTSGDMIQDLKVGHMIGATPWRMEIAEILSVIFVSFSLVFPMMYLHKASILAGHGGIGGSDLPAPQANLMAELSKGIITGHMPWGLIFIGMFLALLLILIKAPSPMLIAVGMYLPFETTFAIYIGGIIKYIFDKIYANSEDFDSINKKGILIASGLVAGEAIIGIVIAILFVTLKGMSIADILLPAKIISLFHNISSYTYFIIFVIVFYMLVFLPGKTKQ